MNFIFLDVDGVLNTYWTQGSTKNGYRFVEDQYIENLKKLVDHTDAKIVLSSDWRYGVTDPDRAAFRQDLDELCGKLSKHGLHIYDVTPHMDGRPRGEEIQAWLSAHPDVCEFVILDDRYDMAPNMDRLVNTSEDEGFDRDKLSEAMQLFRRE